MAFKLLFEKFKETKGTHVFREEERPEGVVVGQLYIKKAAAAELGNPEVVEVTVEAIK